MLSLSLPQALTHKRRQVPKCELNLVHGIQEVETNLLDSPPPFSLSGPSPSYPTSKPRIVVIFAQLQNPNQYFENKIGWIIFFSKLSPLPLAAVTI
jgi:hypothetical protein